MPLKCSCSRSRKLDGMWECWGSLSWGGTEKLSARCGRCGHGEWSSPCVIRASPGRCRASRPCCAGTGRTARSGTWTASRQNWQTFATLHFTPLCGCEPAGGRSIFGALGTQSRKSEVEKKLSSWKIFSKMLFSCVYLNAVNVLQHHNAIRLWNKDWFDIII